MTARRPFRIGWFSTGRGPTSRKLLAAAHDEIASGRLNAEITVVFCNRAPGEDPNTDVFLDQVNGYDLPLVTLSSRDFRRRRGEKVVRKGQSLPDWRRDYDREVIRLLEPLHVRSRRPRRVHAHLLRRSSRQMGPAQPAPGRPGGPRASGRTSSGS